jgi:hypothetical protein
MISFFVIGLTVCAGIVSLFQAWFGQDTLPHTVRVSYAVYGCLFLIGSAAYFIKPRLGAAILVVSLLSMIGVAPLVGFPVWIEASTASRIGMITGCITAAGIVSEPLFNTKKSQKPRK